MCAAEVAERRGPVPRRRSRPVRGEPRCRPVRWLPRPGRDARRGDPRRDRTARRAAASSSRTSVSGSRTSSSPMRSSGGPRRPVWARHSAVEGRGTAVRLVKRVVVVLLVVVVVAVGGRGGRAGLDHEPRDAADRGHAPGRRSRRGRHRRPRCGRIRPHHRDHRRTTCSSPRASSTPRSGCGRWRSGGASRPDGCPSCSGRARSRGPVHPDPRLAASRGTGSRRALRRDARDPRCLCRGVNAWLDANRGNLGLAFVVTGANPEPWTVLDTLTWGKVQAWNLGGNMSSEIFRFLAERGSATRHGPTSCSRRREFGPVIVPGRTSSPTEIDRRAGPGRPATAAAAARRPPAASPPRPDRQPGRRLARRRLARRRAPAARRPRRLGWRPRLGSRHRLEQLGRRLRRCRRRAARCSRTTRTWGSRCRRSGSSTASTARPSARPARSTSPASASRASRAWSSATTPGSRGVRRTPAVDVQDLVIETLDPADPTHYLGPDGTSLPFTVRTEQIAVSGGDPVTIEVRETVHGPILNDVDERLADSPLMALRWSAIHPAAGPDRTYEAILGLEHRGRLRGLPGRPVAVRRAIPELRLRRRRRPHRLPAAGLRADPLRPRRSRRSAGPWLDRRRGVARPDPVRATCRGRSTRSMAGS